jgi:hypothetical protein
VARFLDQSLLEEFEVALREAGAGVILDSLAPGVDEAALDQAQAVIGVRLADEARVWWSWRSGYIPLVPVTDLLPLDVAISACHQRRQHAIHAAADAARDRIASLSDPERWHDRRWLPIFGPPQYAITCIDCDVPDATPAPIRRPSLDSIGDPDFARPIAPSLGALVQHWIRCLNDRTFVFDAERATWQWVSADVVVNAS